MPDPLDLLSDIGPNNEFFEDIRQISQRELQENLMLVGKNPMFLLEPQLDPLEILVQCECLDEEEGCQSGHHLLLYYETHETTILRKRKHRP